MLITMIVLLGLFVITAFTVVYVIIDNKGLKDKVKYETRITDSLRKAKNDSEVRLVKIYDNRIAVLLKEATKVDNSVADFTEKTEDKIFHLEKENKKLKKLVKQLKSVSISERAFLIDLEE